LCFVVVMCGRHVANALIPSLALREADPGHLRKTENRKWSSVIVDRDFLAAAELSGDRTRFGICDMPTGREPAPNNAIRDHPCRWHDYCLGF
jgi:hypothetical protein